MKNDSPDPTRLPHLLDSERVITRRHAAPPEWSELLLGERRVVFVAAEPPKAASDVLLAGPQLVFPGSFNPLHDGHREMIAIAEKRKCGPVWLELSITNVDKPPLDFLTIRGRLDQLAGYSVCLTRAPTFVEKAELFPGATFVVGVDTMMRVADERYYQGNVEERDAALERLAEAGVRFLTFGRLLDGRFASLEDLSLPAPLADLCESVSQSEFREDISSTALRTGSIGALQRPR